METTTVTRKQLYEEVWTEPMARLAKRYGLSDVGLAKICAAHNIPRPPRGYWAKKRSGQTARRTRLPNPDQDDSIVIHQQPGPEATPHIDEAYAVAKKILDSPDRIQVADTLVGAHKLVRGAHQGLKHAETDEHGLIVPPKDIGLCIRVTKTHLRRALQAMDALLKALEQREYSVSPPFFMSGWLGPNKAAPRRRDAFPAGSEFKGTGRTGCRRPRRSRSGTRPGIGRRGLSSGRCGRCPGSGIDGTGPARTRGTGGEA